MKHSRVLALSLIFLGVMLTSTITILTVRAPGPAWQGYVKPSCTDYAPSGMPDFDEHQDGWGPAAGAYTWCGPVATANCLWWLDSEYESLVNPYPVPPPTVSDHFALLTSFGAFDDHAPGNVLPFVPILANMMDTDGLRTHDGHIGTRWLDLENGINLYLAQQNMTNLFQVQDSQFPFFDWIDNNTESCHAVVLFLEFYQLSGTSWLPLTSDVSLESGHFVTCAGANASASQVLISDPIQDAYESGTAPGRSPVPDAPGYTPAAHDNATLVSQDAYTVAPYVFPVNPMPPPPYLAPAGYPPVASELQNYLQTMGYPPNYHAFIRAAISISPKQVQEWPGYIKSSYPDYSPSGMPDFDEKQNQFTTAPGQYTWCVPVAVANSLWWLDSKYESIMFAHPVPPPTISDHFGLVNSSSAQWDDHDPNNVAGLVTNLAVLMDTDGIRSGDHHMGTRWTDIQSGIQTYLKQQGVAGLFEVHNSSFPTFAWIDNETTSCQDVELFLEIWQLTGTGWTNTTVTEPSLEFGHCVTCAGSNLTSSQVLISDPYQDAYEAGTAPGRSPALHGYPHNSTVHNDAQYVSQDAFSVTPFAMPPVPPPPPGYPAIVYELQGYLQTMGFDASYHAFIRGAVATSPTGIHDVAVTNVKTSKDGCKPMPTVGDNSKVNVTVTVANKGTFSETFNVTLYANSTTIDTQTVTGLASGANTTLTYLWNTTHWTHGNYTISAYATPVAGEGNTTDNTYTDGLVKVVIPGDINGDGSVDIYDAILLAGGFNSTPEKPNWNTNADLNSDGVVDIYDAIILANHYNQHE
jgi:hypothetical protein